MLKKVHVQKAVNQLEDLFIYQKIGSVNGNVISIVQVENRTLDFHVHEHSDELFYVIEGAFCIETNEGTISLDAGEFVIVPRNTRHRPIVKERAKFLMVEMEGTLNKENSGSHFIQI